MAHRLMKAAHMMMPRLVACALLALAATASADELSTSQRSPDEPTVAITMSPVHLFIPMIELTTEIRAASRVGIAVIAGAARFHERTTNTPVALFEGGASVRYYALGSFRTGLQLGFEALYVHAKTDSTTYDANVVGLGLAPFAGYKWTHGSGFTFEGQLGATYMAARARASSGTSMAMEEKSKVGPMLNLNVGYSF
jgi:hypothetical protein